VAGRDRSAKRSHRPIRPGDRLRSVRPTGATASASDGSRVWRDRSDRYMFEGGR